MNKYIYLYGVVLLFFFFSNISFGEIEFSPFLKAKLSDDTLNGDNCSPELEFSYYKDISSIDGVDNLSSFYLNDSFVYRIRFIAIPLNDPLVLKVRFPDTSFTEFTSNYICKDNPVPLVARKAKLNFYNKLTTNTDVQMSIGVSVYNKTSIPLQNYDEFIGSFGVVRPMRLEVSTTTNTMSSALLVNVINNFISPNPVPEIYLGLKSRGTFFNYTSSLKLSTTPVVPVTATRIEQLNDYYFSIFIYNNNGIPIVERKSYGATEIDGFILNCGVEHIGFLYQSPGSIAWYAMYADQLSVILNFKPQYSTKPVVVQVLPMITELQKASFDFNVLGFKINVTNSNLQYYRINVTNVEVINPLGSFPYGYKGGNIKELVFGLNLVIPVSEVSRYLGLYLKDSFSTLQTLNYIATEGLESLPAINDISFTRLINNNVLIRVNFTSGISGSGIKNIELLQTDVSKRSIFLTLSDLTFGNQYNGVLEKVVNIAKYRQLDHFIITKNSLKQKIYDNQLLYGFDNSINPDNIKSFWFKEKEKGSGKNTLYFSLAEADPMNLPGFKLIYTSEIAKAHARDEMEFDFMKWDQSLNMFTLDFVMPSLSLGTNLEYIFLLGGVEYTPFSLATWVGENSTISFSNYYSHLIIPDVYIYYQQNPEYIIPKDNGKTEIGWMMAVSSFVDEEGGLPFETLNLTVTSEYDLQGFKFSFAPCDSFDSDSGSFFFVTFKIDNSACRSQTYKISEITLRDTHGFYMNSTVDPLYPYVISPFFRMNYTMPIKVICPYDNVDTASPTLFAQSISKTIMDVTNPDDLDLQVLFFIQDASNLSSRHTPIIYLSSSDEVIQFPAVNSEQTSSTSTQFNNTIQVPYLFGYPHGFTIQVFGIHDVFMNLAGFYIGYVNVTNTLNAPHIQNVKITTSLGNSSELTIEVFGKGFGYDRSLFALQINQNVYSNAAIVSASYVQLTIPYIQTNNSVIIASRKLGAQSKPFIYKIIKSLPRCTPSNDSSSISSSSESGVGCLDPTCGNNGYCIPGRGCICTSPWVGQNCTSKVISIPNPDIDPTKPNVNLTTTEDIVYSSMVAIESLLEMDSNHNVINTYDLKEWIYTPITIDGIKSYNYTTKITVPLDNSVTDIAVLVQWYEIQTNITFAGQKITMNPSSLKYRVDFTKYSFSTSMNYLQLIFRFGINGTEDQSCSVLSQGDVYGGEYFQLNINNHGFFGRYIKRAVLDNRSVAITNVAISNSTESNQVFSRIGVNIPYYQRNAIIDPDFSVLVNTKGAQDEQGSICNNNLSNNNKKLSTAQLAGIIVASCVVAIAITVSIVYYVIKKAKFKQSQKRLDMKLQNFNKE